MHHPQYVSGFFYLFVDCGQLDSIKNGRVIVEAGTSYGLTASYICNTGYQLTGSSTRFCQASEQWSGQAPSCGIIGKNNLCMIDFFMKVF